MKRIILSSLLTVGLVFLASNNAMAQRRGGGGPGIDARGAGPAVQNTAPAVHNEAAPAIRNDVRTGPAIANDRPATHPFYGSDHGQNNEWRYAWNGGRWWYWTPLNAWAYWNDGRWTDYGSQPYTTYYRGATTAPSGWYWSNDQHQWYWFDGSTLQPAQQ